MKWLIIVMLNTGQPLALPVDTEKECRDTLAQIQAGEIKSITLEGGLWLPIAKGLKCERSDIFEAARGRV